MLWSDQERQVCKELFAEWQLQTIAVKSVTERGTSYCTIMKYDFHDLDLINYIYTSHLNEKKNFL